jgi:3D (Asp-Asp-Asp) domain-containing protein
MKLGLALVAALAATLAASALLAAVDRSERDGACQSAQGSTREPPNGWIATSYGPPWGGIEGNGVTATGLDLTSAPAAYEVAVDPGVIALGSYVRVEPNPFGTSRPFYAGDTGGEILGKHVDIYDWRGRTSQSAWGQRAVSVTPTPTPGAGNLLGGVAPAAPTDATVACQAWRRAGMLGLTAAQTARILSDGSASAPQQAPRAVKLALAAGNLIHARPYPEPDVHFGSLATLWPAYDCSGATSFVLYAAGLLGADALDSTGLESYGRHGPGRWITVYANSAHAWIVVAGIALDTAGYGGPPIPGGSGPRWRSEPLANLQDGTSYVARHPAGL